MEQHEKQSSQQSQTQWYKQKVQKAKENAFRFIPCQTEKNREKTNNDEQDVHTDFNSETFIVSPKAKDKAKGNEAQFSNQGNQKGFSQFCTHNVFVLESVITCANLIVNLYFAKTLLNNSVLQLIKFENGTFLFDGGCIYAQKEGRKYENR